MVMMRYAILMWMAVLSCERSLAAPIDTLLKQRLDLIMADDQRYREAMVMQPGPACDSIARQLGISPDDVGPYYSGLQQRLDSVNLHEVEAIISTAGYPGKSLVGTPTNEAAFYVIQHSDKIARYFPVIERAGRRGELRYTLVAMMQDRMLRDAGKEQLYGSQYAGYAMKDSATGARVINWFLWPVKDYAHVNERRKKAGFEDSVAENAASQGIVLKTMTLQDVREQCPWLLTSK
jgi:hypothetical protein